MSIATVSPCVWSKAAGLATAAVGSACHVISRDGCAPLGLSGRRRRSQVAGAGTGGASASASAAAGGGESEGELIDVEFCVLCDYQPRYDVLARIIEEAHPGRFLIRPNPMGNPRNGAFEVTWRRRGIARQELWSKLQTGEPSCVEAAKAVAKVISSDLSHIG